MNETERERFAGQWLTRYGTPYDSDEVSRIASPDAYRQRRLYWMTQHLWSDLASLLVDIEATATKASGRMPRQKSLALAFREVQLAATQIREKIDVFLEKSIKMNDRSLGVSVWDLIRDFPVTLDNAHRPSRSEPETEGTILEVTDELRAHIDSIEASDSIEQASDGLNAILAVTVRERLVARSIARSAVPSMRDPALAELAGWIESWMKDRVGTVGWDDVYRCLDAYGHDVQHLSSEGSAIQTAARRLRSFLTT